MTARPSSPQEGASLTLAPINPWRACAARVTVVVLCVCLSVCVSVCLSTTILALQATRRLMSDTNTFSATRAGKECGDFAVTIAFERYGVKTSEKTNMHYEYWLTSTRFSPFSAPRVSTLIPFIDL